MLIFDKKLEKINKKLDKILKKMEVKQIEEYVELMGDTKKLLWKHFVMGIAKGIGIAVGFTILGAAVIYFLRQIVMLNLPVIGAFIKDIMDIVEELEQVK